MLSFDISSFVAAQACAACSNNMSHWNGVWFNPVLYDLLYIFIFMNDKLLPDLIKMEWFLYFFFVNVGKGHGCSKSLIPG